jgi:hypothetical protein
MVSFPHIPPQWLAIRANNLCNSKSDWHPTFTVKLFHVLFLNQDQSLRVCNWVRELRAMRLVHYMSYERALWPYPIRIGACFFLFATMSFLTFIYLWKSSFCFFLFTFLYSPFASNSDCKCERASMRRVCLPLSRQVVRNLFGQVDSKRAFSHLLSKLLAIRTTKLLRISVPI